MAQPVPMSPNNQLKFIINRLTPGYTKGKGDGREGCQFVTCKEIEKEISNDGMIVDRKKIGSRALRQN